MRQYTKQWIKFITCWSIIIFTIYSLYSLYLPSTTDENIKISNKILETPKKVLTNYEKQELKNNFSKIDMNFTTKVIRNNSKGLTIQRNR